MGLDRRRVFLESVRREFDRYLFHVDAEVHWRALPYRGRVKNISQAGMFIEMTDPPPVGSAFTAYLALNLPLRLDCVVRHVVIGRGVGVAFSVREKEKRRFEALLTALAAAEDPIRDWERRELRSASPMLVTPKQSTAGLAAPPAFTR